MQFSLWDAMVATCNLKAKHTKSTLAGSDLSGNVKPKIEKNTTYF